MRILLAFLVALLCPMTAKAYESPAFTIVEADGKIEIRDYDPMLIASVLVDATGREATNAGFRALADFIFGNNAGRRDIDMTVPVTQQAAPEEIAMTVPVQQTAATSSMTVISFVMPSQYTLETLPRPNNPNITILEVPTRRIATLEFRGSSTEAQQARAEAELRAWITARGLVAEGTATFAYYSGPWVPGPLRRNEAQIQLAIPASREW